MIGCPDANELAQLVDGKLADTARRRVEHHLDACGACTHTLAELAWVIAPGRAAPPGYRWYAQRDAATWDAECEHGRVTLAFGMRTDPALVAVRHPNVARVFEVADDFVATERLGITERAWRSQPRARAAIVDVWRRALAGLHALHRTDITLTLTPDRVFVDGERVVVGSFGRSVERASGYLAPEVLAGGPPSPRADQFAACVALVEALTGRRPFSGATAGALAVAIAAPREPLGLGRTLDAALARGLAADPAARWPDVAALAEALGRRSWFSLRH